MCQARGETEPSAGILLVVQEPGEDGESIGMHHKSFLYDSMLHYQLPFTPNNLYFIARLWCAFTTESMAIAYGSSMNPKVKVRYSPIAPNSLLTRLGDSTDTYATGYDPPQRLQAIPAG